MPEPDTEPPVVRMANDIARQFAHLPAPLGAAAIRQHVRSFWEPRMRVQLAEELDRHASALDPLVVAAFADATVPEGPR